MKKAIEYKVKSWERRGHFRTLKSGIKVYVSPTTCNRHDEPSETPEGLYAGVEDTSTHSVAVALDEILAAHDAVAEFNSLRVGGYETSFDIVDVGREFRAINVNLPAYRKGYSNAQFDTKKWGKYDTYAETCVIRTCLRYLCCAVAQLRDKPVAKEINVAGHAAETYVKDDVHGKSRRHVKIRNVDICFASNEENSGVAYATVEIKGERRTVPIWCCHFARRLVKLVRDVAILSSERGEELAAAAA